MEVLDLGNLLKKCDPTRSRRSRGKNNHMFSENLEGLMLICIGRMNHPKIPPNPVSMMMARQGVRLEGMHVLLRISFLSSGILGRVTSQDITKYPHRVGKPTFWILLEEAPGFLHEHLSAILEYIPYVQRLFGYISPSGHFNTPRDRDSYTLVL